MTDASNVAVGVVLQQQVKNLWQPLSYFSCKLKCAETEYSIFDRELLAIELAIKHFCLSPHSTFTIPDAKFDFIHIDIVRPLPPLMVIHIYSYVLTGSCVGKRNCS